MRTYNPKTYYISKESHDKIKKLSKKNKTSMSEIARISLMDFFIKKHRKTVLNYHFLNGKLCCFAFSTSEIDMLQNLYERYNSTQGNRLRIEHKLFCSRNHIIDCAIKMYSSPNFFEEDIDK